MINHSVLSGPSQQLLETLQDCPDAVSVQSLAGLLHKHHNTVREQLAGLEERGLVRREREVSGERGRPAWLYRVTRAAHRIDHDYSGLATALVTQLERTSADPEADGIASGERWGASLVHPEESVRGNVLTVLDELGFEPEPDTATGAVRLRACPLIDEVGGSTTMVCGVHRGVIRGLVRAAGGDPEDSELIAFYEPDACLVTLTEVPPSHRA